MLFRRKLQRQVRLTSNKMGPGLSRARALGAMKTEDRPDDADLIAAAVVHRRLVEAGKLRCLLGVKQTELEQRFGCAG